MIGALMPAWFSAVLATAVVDHFAKPKVAPWRRRSARVIGLSLTATSWLFILFFAISGRAWFAAACTVGIVGLLTAVSNVKFMALREPVVFSDLALFVQSIRHPRLYFPHLSRTQLFSAAVGMALFVLAFWLDSVRQQLAYDVLALLWIALFLLARMLARGVSVSLVPEADQAQHGYFPIFVTYLLNGLSFQEIQLVREQLNASPYASRGCNASTITSHDRAGLPDVVVIQSESFFDIRKTGLTVKRDLFENFDTLRKSGVCAGTLVVPAWGANTMRTEHAFLSGLPNTVLRYASFYPYAFVRQATPGMPWAFRAKGYRCTAVHPYSGDFFFRRKVFPRMGFDDFVDEAGFSDAVADGPYLSDEAVTDWLIRKLDDSTDQPQYLFAITIENHGPFHLETATKEEADALYEMPDGKAIDNLTVYLRHLGNADKMMGRLREFLVSRKRNTLLCLYGDHVPAISDVYDALHTNPRNSDYAIWCNYQAEVPGATSEQGLQYTPEQLGITLARLAGAL